MTSPVDPLRLAYAQAARAAGCPEDQMRNFARAGYVAQPKQLLFHGAARLCDAAGGPTQIGFGGARGPGKSHAIFAQVCLDDCQRVPNLKVLYLRKIAKNAYEQLEDMRKSVLAVVPHVFKRQAGIVTFPNSSRVIIGHFNNESDVDNYLGIEYDLIAIEEATTLTASKYRTLRDSNRTSKDDWRPRIYTSTNPGGVGHAWYKKLFIDPWQKHTETDTRFIFATVGDNLFVDAGYKAKLEENTGWRLRAYRYGDWDIAAGQFFTTWDYATHVVSHVLPVHGWRYWLALDYGFAHYTAVYLFGENGDGTLYVLDEHAERGWLVERHAAAIHALLERNGLSVGDLDALVAGADIFSRERDGGTVAEEYARNGLTWTPANNDRIQGAAEGMRRLGDPAHGIRPTLFIHDRCRRLIECLPALEHDPHRPEDVLKWDTDDEGNGGDDFFDGWRYGVMQAARQRQGYAVNPLAGWRG